MNALVIDKTSFQFKLDFNRDMYVDYHETIVQVPIANDGTRKWNISMSSSKSSLDTFRLSITGKPVENEKYDEKCFFKFRALNEEHYLPSIRYKSGLLQIGTTNFVFETLELARKRPGFNIKRARKLHFVLTLGTLNEKSKEFGAVANDGQLSAMARILDDKLFTDMIIKTRDGEFPCHRCILASSCKYFELMFTTDMKESRECVVDWNGVYGSDTVKTLLLYLYHGENKQLMESIKTVCKELLDVARLCELDNLEDLCQIKMIEIMVAPIPSCTVSDIVQFLLIALKYKLKCLLESAIMEFTRRFDKIQECEDWKALTLERQNKIFGLAMNMNIRP